MKTRRSVKNQNILFSELFKPTEKGIESVATKCCFNCVNYPRDGRGRAHCTLTGLMVRGGSKNGICFRMADYKTREEAND